MAKFDANSGAAAAGYQLAVGLIYRMELLVTAIAAFIATNLDDLLVLTLLFGTRRMANSSIVLGQYAGILALVIISMAASVLGYFVDVRFFGFMGFFPLGLGLVQFYRHIHQREKEPKPDKLPATSGRLNQLSGVASLTIGNGGDNISVYTPFFAGASVPERFGYILVFLIMVALWWPAGLLVVEASCFGIGAGEVRSLRKSGGFCCNRPVYCF